ncbi:glycosyltransferase [Microbacterium sp. zg.B48]|uniref:glycosyltransferase n=1 Tax=Microbacterium sp. zg.B48 TaxID=2969408 RepID=UPI00214AC88F|nr:glycosyltransferase [Microbacterium sp. zg.B48]MCR2764765.1 glycosyltransferase [Microbacterium sp. zg.B48]
MSGILFASVPVHGHVSPLLPLARHFVDRGDHVTFLTGARFADAVSATGAEHVALPEAADFDDRTVSSKYPEREGMPAVKAIAFDFEHIFVRPAEQQYAALSALVTGADVDVVVCDPLFFGAAIYAEHSPADRAPVVVAGLVPLNYPGPGLAPFGMGLAPMGGLAGSIRNTILAAATKRIFRPVNAAADEVAHRAIGRSLSGAVLDWLPRADAIGQLTVPTFEYRRPDAPASVVFTGPVSAAAAPHARPEWWRDVEAARTVVHVTQGTIANDDPSELILPTIHGLADSGALVVVATGGLPVQALGTLPVNVRAAEFLPYDELFAHTDLFITNGGYGGVQYSLSHGVPLVVAPGKEDKVEVAARVAWSGTGVNLRTQRPTAAAIKGAVERVTTEPRYRRAAQRIAADIAASSGAAGFAAMVDRIIAGAEEPFPAQSFAGWRSSSPASASSSDSSDSSNSRGLT